MFKVIAVCSGNTCRSPLLGAALKLLSDGVSVRTACAPNCEKDDSKPLPCMPNAFKNAAEQLIQLGIVNRDRRRRLSKIVLSLSKHRAKVYERLRPQPTGDEVFVAAAPKHARNLKAWAKAIRHTKPHIIVAGITDFAWRVHKFHECHYVNDPARTREMEAELADAYRALATLTILRAREILLELRMS